MILKTLFFVLLMLSCEFSNVHGDDDDCSNIDLAIRFIQFIFTETDITLEWQLGVPTDCPVLYRLILTDEEYGVIRDERLEINATKLEVMSPCISYRVELRAINKANTSVEGPPVSNSIRFVPRVQIAPRLRSLNIGPTSANVSWALEGKLNRCPLKTLYLDGGNNFNISVPLQNLTTPVESVPVEITSLKPNSMYYFQVSVENNVGLSPTTQMAFQTLALD